MRHYRGSLFALVMLLLLGGYAYFFEYRESVIKEERRAEQTRLIQAESNQISGLKVTTEDTSYEVKIKSGSEDWVLLSEDETHQVDLASVNETIDRLSQLSYSVEVAQGESVNWGLFGLKNPKFEISVSIRDGRTTVLNVSDKSNFEGQVYLRRGNEDLVVLVDPFLNELGLRESFFYRNKNILRLGMSEINAIRIKMGKGSFQLTKENDQWISPAHPKWQLDQERVRDFLLHLLETEGTSVVSEVSPAPEQQKEWGFGDREWSVQLSTTQGKQWIGRLGESEDQRYFFWTTLPELVFELEGADVAELLEFDLREVRDKKAPFQFAPEEVQEIRLSHSSSQEVKTFSRDSSGWIMKGARADKLKSVTTQVIEDYLSRLSSIKAISFEQGSGEESKLYNLAELMDAKGRLIRSFRWGESFQTTGDDTQQMMHFKSSNTEGLISVPAARGSELNLKSLEKALEVNET